MMMQRDPDLEADLLNAAGDDGTLCAFAASRAGLDPVTLPRDFDQEAREELADCANYLRWGIQHDPASRERRARALAAVVAAWRELAASPSP